MSRDEAVRALEAGIHAAEEKAMRETISRYSPEFVEALDFYAKAFHAALHPGDVADEP